MLSPRAMANLGVGYGPRLMANLGIWPVEEQVVVSHGAPAGGADAIRRNEYDDRDAERRRRIAAGRYGKSLQFDDDVPAPPAAPGMPAAPTLSARAVGSSETVLAPGSEIVLPRDRVAEAEDEALLAIVAFMLMDE